MNRRVDPKIVTEIVKRVPGWVYLPIAIGAGISLVIIAQQWAAWKFERKLMVLRETDKAEMLATVSNAVAEAKADVLTHIKAGRR
jgi:hypothetical protein